MKIKQVHQAIFRHFVQEGNTYLGNPMILNPKSYDPVGISFHFEKIEKIVVTVHNSSREKVMFSQVCVKNSVHRGEHAWQGHVHSWGRGACAAGETAIAVDGTHPSGMHSCFENVTSTKLVFC